MTKKIIPFIKKAAPEIVENGDIGNLKYEVLKKGVIHIFDSSNIFKKDCLEFDTEFEKNDFKNLSEGQTVLINGSGDNANLLFTKKNGNIEISLKPKEFSVIEKLKKIIKR